MGLTVTEIVPPLLPGLAALDALYHLRAPADRFLLLYEG
jgi:hypothetical protein